MKKNEIPKFGNLQNLRVINAASVVAGPFLCGLLAEQGADVIELESTRVPDMFRNFGDAWSVERRNQRMVSLNIPTPEGKEILLRMVKDADVLVESSKGGTWDKWGLSDEVLWEANPALVIVHISGFGQTGHPDYVSLPSFDSIGQAFSGFMAINGMPEPNPPYAVKPYTGDYITGLFGAWACLAAVIRSRETGKGESIDVTQYESLARLQANYMSDGLNKGIQYPRMGNHDITGACNGTERCKDGWIFIAVGGAGPVGRLIKLLGFENDPDFQGPIQTITRQQPKRAKKFVKALEDFCLERTVDEVANIMSELKVPCSKILTYKDMLEHPHYQARETITEWYDEVTDRKIKGINLIPKFKNNPGQIFRGGPKYGIDNEDVMHEFGYTDEEIQAFYEKGIMNPPTK
ncbi:CoA transferase [Neobacillus sp. OS1-32]|uniref:CoA transferase n=1 Tax=Neobacillus sp. OS1-32 TaxID=3070682 RepID=UPI0027E1146B|nr:CoA transferase [Neobacillus sp. OS1-32]WML29893.1 CoA transferase [Neobacillus sp. OS1-32]